MVKSFKLSVPCRLSGADHAACLLRNSRSPVDVFVSVYSGLLFLRNLIKNAFRVAKILCNVRQQNGHWEMFRHWQFV